MLLRRAGAAGRAVTKSHGTWPRISAAALSVAAQAAPKEEQERPVVGNFINGQVMQSKAETLIPIRNPATGVVLRYVPESTTEELEMAVQSAKAAFPQWRATSVSKRSRVMFELQRLIREREDELVNTIVEENGKTIEDAKGDVFRGLEVVEQCCALGSHLMGEAIDQLADGVDTYSYRQPLGVCAGIAPFNFPVMIPLWMFPVAVTAGCTYVLKPSEKVPTSAMLLAELATEAGLPPGVLNVAHGGKRAVDFVCDATDVKAVSFVGGNTAGEYIHARATQNGKRCQANLGAKNHAVILPDADKEQTLNALASASMGAAGQRCMALSVAVFVGRAKEWIPELAEKCSKLAVGDGADPSTAVGPMITRDAKLRAETLIQAALDAGATLALDGRDPPLPLELTERQDYVEGNFLGPTVLADVDADNPAYVHELFAPVLSCAHVDTLDDAIHMVNANPYGNGTAVFTRSGAAARKFQRDIDVGQVGINTPIPVPLPFFSFTGSRASIRGDLHFYGKDGVRFFTQIKTITSNWRALGVDDDAVTGDKGAGAPHSATASDAPPSTAMPTMK